MGLYPRSILILKNDREFGFMTYSISGHIVNIILVTVGYIVSMLFVQFVIIPVQQTYLPMITTFAALIFPLHGVRFNPVRRVILLDEHFKSQRNIVYIHIDPFRSRFFCNHFTPIRNCKFLFSQC